MALRYVIMIFCEFIVIEARNLSSESRLIHFAIFDDVMYPNTNHTIGSPSQLTLEACAERCLMKSNHDFVQSRKRRNSNMDTTSTEIQHHDTQDRDRKHEIRDSENSKNGNITDDICTSFEYIDSIGYCLLLNQAAANDIQGYSALKKAEGTTYFELSKSIQDLYKKKENQVLDGKDTYHNIIYNISTNECTSRCINASGFLCNSFVYSSSMRVCGMSSQVANGHRSLQTTSSYDYYQYSGIWPCNVTLPWEYRPRVIASQRYPYVCHGSFTCYFRLVAPPGKQVVLQVKTFFTNKPDCSDSTDGVFIFDGDEQEANVVETFCEEKDNKRHPSIRSSSGFLIVKMVQTQHLILSRLEYDFVATPRNCASSPCLFNASCLKTEDSFQCICPNGTHGNRCEKYIGECFRSPCINGTCYPSSATSGYKCACAEGFTGTSCEYNINECFSSPCMHGYCKDLINDYECVCNDAYTGRHCEINKSLAACSRHVCRFGTCALNKSGSYCQCFPGFTGFFCETDIDDCESIPCVRGVCVDHINSYNCNCSTGYAGKHCDILVDDPCRRNPCHHGYCSVNDEGFTCICENGFTGLKCESKLTLCHFYCRHGNCVRVNSSDPFCICHDTFTGKHCETSINRCKDDLCIVSHTGNMIFVNNSGYKSSPTAPLRYNRTIPSTQAIGTTSTKQTHQTLLTTETRGLQLWHNEKTITSHFVTTPIAPYTQHIALSSTSPSRGTVNTVSKSSIDKMVHSSSVSPMSPGTNVAETVPTFDAKHTITDSPLDTTEALSSKNGMKISTVKTTPSTKIQVHNNSVIASAVRLKTTVSSKDRSETTPESARLRTTNTSGDVSKTTPVKIILITAPAAKDKLETTANVHLITTTSVNYIVDTSSANAHLITKTPTVDKLDTTSANVHLITKTPTVDKLDTSSANAHLMTATATVDKLDTTSAIAHLITTTPAVGKLDTTSANAHLMTATTTVDKLDTTSTNAHLMTTTPTVDKLDTTNANVHLITKTPTVDKLDTTSANAHLMTTTPTVDKLDTTSANVHLMTTTPTVDKLDITSVITKIPANNKTVTIPDAPGYTPTSRKVTTRTLQRTTLKQKRTTPHGIIISTSWKPQQWTRFHAMTATKLFSPTVDFINTELMSKPTVTPHQRTEVAHVFKNKQKPKYRPTTIVTEVDKTTKYVNVQKNNSSKDVPQGDSVNGVITIESIIIGALFVALLIVVATALFMLYKRTRSGTVYISSSGPDVQSTTPAKERYSARKIHSDHRSGKLFRPRAVSSQLYQRHTDARAPVYAMPKRRLAGQASSETSSAATSPTSSRSDYYDEVESPDLDLPQKIRRIVPVNRTKAKERNVVNICRGNGVISPDDSKHETSNHTQEEFQSLLEEILNAEEYMSLRNPGTRQSSQYIAGTDGKGEADTRR